MAVRQYVGARYVPKFYQNTQNPDSSEWEANQSYEALTIVTYNNSSFTSKIPVPAGIGNPAQNPTYWVLSGNYNAQVEQYRQETRNVAGQLNDLQTSINNEGTERQEADTALSNRITDITKAKTNIIVFGDSWADTRNYGTDVSKNPSATQLETVLKIRFPFATIHNYAYGGTSFLGGVVNFNMQLDEFIKEDIDPSTILFVILMGGVNQIKTDITTTKNQAIAFFNNLSSHIWQSTRVFWFQNFSMQDDTLNTIPVMRQFGNWNDINNSLHNYVTATPVHGWFSSFKEDMLHPTYNSFGELAINICNFIMGQAITTYPIDFAGNIVDSNNEFSGPLIKVHFIIERTNNALDVYTKFATWFCTVSSASAGTPYEIAFEKPLTVYGVYDNTLTVANNAYYVNNDKTVTIQQKVESGLTSVSGYTITKIAHFTK